MIFMILIKYTVIGFFGSGLLILLAKGIMAHLIQRREDYYEGCCNSSGGVFLGDDGDNCISGCNDERSADCNDENRTGCSDGCNKGCDDMETQGGESDV